VACLVAFSLAGVVRGADENVPVPKEYGVYAKTDKGLTRIIPNMIYDDQNILYVESSRPARFLLNSVQYFILYGKHDIQYLTLNSLKPFR